MIIIGKYPSIKLKSENSLFIKFKKFDQSLVDKVKSLPLRYYIPDEKVWEVPITDIDRVVNTFGIDNIQVFNDFSEFTEYSNYLQSLKKGKKSIAELKEYYRTLRPKVDYKFKTEPQGHQIESFNLSLQEPAMFITDVMGLGKTKQALDIMDYRKSIGLVKHVLVICCINSNKYNWVREIAKHSWNNCQVIDGTRKQKIEKLNLSWMFFYNIINVESLRSSIGYDTDGNEIETNGEIIQFLEKAFDNGLFNAVIIDEAHKMNNHRSQQGKNLNRIHCDYKIALTGTPITKHVDKVWNILHWFGVITEPYWKFRQRYCELGGYTGYDVIGYKNLEELHQRIDRVQVRRTKDILDLPPKTYKTVYVEMTKEEKKQYNEIREGIIKDIESGEVDYVNPAVATIRLRQYTDTLKIPKIKELVDDIVDNDGACTIFSCYKDGLFELAHNLKEYDPLILTGDVKKVEDKQALVDQFQTNKNNKVMMGTIQAMSTGFTLTKASYVIFLNKDWTVTNNRQAEDRCHRIGTTSNVTIITVLVKDSIDERVEEILNSDEVYIDRVVDGKITFKLGNKEMLNKLLS